MRTWELNWGNRDTAALGQESQAAEEKKASFQDGVKQKSHVIFAMLLVLLSFSLCLHS